MPLDQSGDLVNESDISMPLGDHLEELRMRLIFAGIGIVVAAGVTFYFVFDLIGWLAQPLLQAQDTMGFPAQTLVTDATAGFTSVILPVGIIAAALLASPWVIYQGWKFVSVGLYSHEKKAVYILTPFSTLMTVLAVSFTYYILLPISLLFFLQFATYFPKVELSSPNPLWGIILDAYGGDKTPPVDAGDQLSTDEPVELPLFPVLGEDPVEPAEGAMWINAQEGKLKALVNGEVRIIGLRSDRLINPLPQLGEYVKFAAMLMFGVTLAFQLPVVMLVLGWTHLFDPKAIASLRKYALFVAFAAGAILTPTDMLSMFVLAVPLYVLFEVGLIMMKIADRGGSSAPDEL
ncbi:twin-arginine translocase subunit TatC [Algisphaera agarilytica]|uniref:Sec-independent protein translocase protein TatC n=1 Tax=Algisphaera agarilytica TaxID=1385975 RepID=A0A7X0H9G4_9BACT|nr:twin-arginine translocase subunit TatC [Algisphaera agarilytica]MBB6431723.1 sec-independent protein translocase protein TatC [Algisphaera agarilytica]